MHIDTTDESIALRAIPISKHGSPKLVHRAILQVFFTEDIIQFSLRLFTRMRCTVPFVLHSINGIQAKPFSISIAENKCRSSKCSYRDFLHLRCDLRK